MWTLDQLLKGARALAALKVPFPAMPLLAALVLLAAAAVAFVVIRPGNEEVRDIAGDWRLSLVVRNGPDPAQFGLTVSCDVHLLETNTALKGEIQCGLFGGAPVEGFVHPTRGAVFIAAPFTESSIEFQGEMISPRQIAGSWQGSTGFSGRFLAIRASSIEASPRP